MFVILFMFVLVHHSVFHCFRVFIRIYHSIRYWSINIYSSWICLIVVILAHISKNWENPEWHLLNKIMFSLFDPCEPGSYTGWNKLWNQDIIFWIKITILIEFCKYMQWYFVRTDILNIWYNFVYNSMLFVLSNF